MITQCDYCGKVFNKKPSVMKSKNYCSKKCRHASHYMEVMCNTCGKIFEKLNKYVFEHNFCSRVCAKSFTSLRMTQYNIKHNPIAMTYERRQKLRKAHLGKGDGKTYTKTFGVHTHRIVAAQILGRPLRQGEVVHHINEDKRDNRPENLMIFDSQKEHARYHRRIKLKKQ